MTVIGVKLVALEILRMSTQSLGLGAVIRVIAVLVLSLSLLGCERELNRTVVSLYPQGLDETARWLFVRTTLNGRQSLVANRFTRPLDEVSVQLPAGTNGEVSFSAELRDSFGAVLARGSANTTVTGIGRYKIDLPLTALPPSQVLLRDGFDDGDIATNSGAEGIGSGFNLSDQPYGSISDKRASEHDGLVQIAGGSTAKQLSSKEPLDPTGTTLIAVVASRDIGQSADGGAHAVAIGWGLPQDILCCGVGLNLSSTEFRLSFDLLPQMNFQDNNRYFVVFSGMASENAVYDSGPATDFILSLYVDRTMWKIEALGNGMEVHQQGTYRPGVTLADVIAAAGAPLHPGVVVARQGGGGSIDSLLVTRPL
jgi:hypothetical protein